VIDDRRDAVVGAHLEELRLELVALADVDAVDAILEPGLLQHNVDFMAVRRGPAVDVNHGIPSEQ